MTTTVATRPLLDLKIPEILSPTPVASAAGVFVIDSVTHADYEPVDPAYFPEMAVTGVTTAYLYSHDEDAWVQCPAPASNGTFGAGNCGAFHPFGPTGTAQAGTSTTITLAAGLTLNRRLDGYKIRITGGTGAGQTATIASNTFGAGPVVTVTSAWAVTPGATSTYVLITGRYYVWIAGTASAFGFKYFDLATMSWSAQLTANPGAVATWATDARMTIVASAITGSFATGTATSATSTTLVNSVKNWTANQWSNAQVRITGGTGTGQVRTISSNTTTALTVSTAWTVTPDATSTYSIEGNDDFVYLQGNNAVALYRYSISANTWTTLAPGVARSAAPGAGMTANVAMCVDAVWSLESSYQRGRFLYCVRGGASTAIDRYDIALNTWTQITYGPLAESFTTGSSSGYDGDARIYLQRDASGRWFYFDIVRQELRPWLVCPLPVGAAAIGDRSWVEEYVDGATKIRWVYHWVNTSQTLYRVLVIA